MIAHIQWSMTGPFGWSPVHIFKAPRTSRRLREESSVPSSVKFATGNLHAVDRDWSIWMVISPHLHCFQDLEETGRVLEHVLHTRPSHVLDMVDILNFFALEKWWRRCNMIDITSTTSAYHHAIQLSHITSWKMPIVQAKFYPQIWRYQFWRIRRSWSSDCMILIHTDLW